MARGVTTEWEDIMVKKGIWKPTQHVPTSEEIFQTQQEQVEKYDNWKEMNIKQIDDAIEDDLDLEDDEYMKAYRDKRLAELKEKANQHFYPHGMIDITK